jgi:hypothetical protein
MSIVSDGGFIVMSWVCTMLTIFINRNYKTGALFERAKVSLPSRRRFR